MDIHYKQEIQTANLTEKELIDLLLKNRHITNAEEFLHPQFPYDIPLAHFGFKAELKKTCTLLEKIKKKNGMIVVYTDYDADGITGGAILWETLHLLGFRVMPYVPDRKTEGYGFSKVGIDTIKKEFYPDLIISVDHGITAAEKVAYAKSIGIPIIITDHHLKPEKVPADAVAIFHIPALSGSGVSYFFSKELFHHFKDQTNNAKRLEDNFKNDYVTLASIGTIADLVPLIGPSRSLVKYGLAACAQSQRLGLKHLIKEAGIEGKPITPYEIGFIIAPRINAVGRLEHAIDALRLLCTVDEKKAHQLATSVGNLNVKRQEMVKQAVAEAQIMIEAQKKLPYLIILQSDSWHEGIIGLIASKIVEKYYRPTLVLTKSDGFYKGSARSIASFHMTEFLRSLKHHLTDVGGHAQAAGFTIQKENIEAFKKEAQQKAAEQITDNDLIKTIEADIKIPLSKVSQKLIETLEQLAPFGIGNPQPTFYSEAEIIEAKLFGKSNEHLKLFVKDPTVYSFPFELIAFSKAQDYAQLARGKKIPIVYYAEIDRWGGNERLRGRLAYSSL